MSDNLTSTNINSDFISNNRTEKISNIHFIRIFYNAVGFTTGYSSFYGGHFGTS